MESVGWGQGPLTFSLRGRLLALWLMSLFAFLVVGALIVGLYRQSAAASLNRDRAQAARACEAIQLQYRFFTAGAAGPAAGFEARQLDAVVTLALRRFGGVHGAIIEGGAFLAGAPPPSLRGALGETAREALAADHLLIRRGGSSVLAACPLGSAESEAAAAAYIEVALFRTVFSRQALAGLAVLLFTLLASAWYLARLVLGFSRRLGLIEQALAGPAADLPILPLTGERELDRLIHALNAATGRLKAAQAQVAQAEKLAALGRMAAGLAHEIRNPLGAIRLRAEGALAGDDARRRHSLAMVLAEAQRLEALTGKLLGFAAAPVPHPDSCRLAEFFESVAAPLRGQAAAKGVAIAAEDAGLTARFDPALTARALENLLRNAVEACDEGGRIEIVGHCSGEGLTITVADTGPGVPAEIAAEIFEPFVTGRPEGTGLGLSIAREMIRAQGGAIALLSAKRGAVFRISLPEACCSEAC